MLSLPVGRLPITYREVSIELAQEQNPEVQSGGSWQPSWCRAYQHLAVIIPYRDRQEHLHMQLYHLHPILQRQLLNYTVFVVEQVRESFSLQQPKEHVKIAKSERENNQVISSDLYMCFCMWPMNLLYFFRTVLNYSTRQH